MKIIMCMYKLYKYVHCCELYINELPEYLKLAMFQFRIGSRHLPTNNYTNSDVTTTSKMCTACNKSVTGDEFHFLFKCEKLKDIRLKYLPVSTVRPLTMHAFINLLQNSDKTVLFQLSKFIKIGLKRYNYTVIVVVVFSCLCTYNAIIIISLICLR